MTCARIIEENCDYINEPIFSTPPGSILGPTRCQELCTEFTLPPCIYWSYIASEMKCDLYDSNDRVCHAVGGPQRPDLAQCMGLYDLHIYRKKFNSSRCTR